MSQTVHKSISFDNPASLSYLSALSIVRNIEHFASEKTISGRTFYLWNAGLILSDWALEQIFEATLEHLGKLDPKWITLFLGSRHRALQFITLLVSPPALDGVISDEVYSYLLAQRYVPIESTPMRYERLNPDYNKTMPLSTIASVTSGANADNNNNNPNSLDHSDGNATYEALSGSSERSSSSLVSGLEKLTSEFKRVVAIEDKCFAEEMQPNDTVNSGSQSSGATRRTDSHAVTSNCRSETNAGQMQQTIDCTGVLRRLVLRHSVSMPEAQLLAGLLACAEPLEITLEDCSKFDSQLEVLELIAAHCPRLRTLKLYRCGSLLFKFFHRFTASSPLYTRAMEHITCGLHWFHLRVLALHELPAAVTSSNSCDLLFHVADRLSTHLLELDLSGADFSSCTKFGWLSLLRHLRVLLLADCKLPKDRSLLISAICELHSLIRLDLQQLRGAPEMDTAPIRVDEYENPARVLQQLSERLPQLDHLDLSGTNLPGNVRNLYVEKVLPGWPSDRKLSFLGLLNCPSKACFRENLPADLIAGEANAEQLIAALEAYADRKLAAQYILNSLVEHSNEQNFTLPIPLESKCFDLLVGLMRRYSGERPVHIRALVLVSILISQINISNISRQRVKNLLLTLVDTLERHDTDRLVVSKSFAILCEVSNNDNNQLLFIFERLVKVLLRIAEHQPFRVSVGDGLLPLRDIALNLLKVLLYRSDVPERRVFGEAGGVRLTLSIIEQRLKENANHDDTALGLCWSLLISATDETHDNCQRFVELGGLKLFVRCVNRWIYQKELLGDMLLAISNVSEVKRLRGHLKSDQLIAIFRELLDKSPGHNSNSFGSVAILSQLLADGDDLWHSHADCYDAAMPPVPLAHSRAAIGEQLVAAIDHWDPNADRHNRYISLLPVHSLITAFDSFASQYWAAWTLNNLTLYKPDMYCPMLVHEDALDILDAVIADSRTSDKLRNWLVLTADRIRVHMKLQQSCCPGSASQQKWIE